MNTVNNVANFNGQIPVIDPAMVQLSTVVFFEARQ